MSRLLTRWGAVVPVLAVLMLVGCVAQPTPSDAPPPMAEPVAVDLEKRGDGELVAPAPAPEAPWANRRRMDIEQLGASMVRVTGLVWEDADGTDQFEALAGTLGMPDYVDSTQEDLSVSLLFQKFLGDAARDVCARRAEGEADGSLDGLLMSRVSTSTTVESDPDAVDENLRELLLRFHGRDLDPASEQMSPWRWLFTSTVHVTDDPVMGWRAVCVGLLTHPDFYSF